MFAIKEKKKNQIIIKLVHIQILINDYLLIYLIFVNIFEI